MANEEYVKETFKPDKLWNCPSIVGSAFPNITPPEEGGGEGMYQIGEDLNLTVGAYSDGIFSFGTVNGDAFRNAEYKAGAYVINKGYVFNYIGDSGKQHVFVNVRNTSSLPSIGMVEHIPVEIACDVLAFWQEYDFDDYISWVYTCMPTGYDRLDPYALPHHWNIKVNGVEFYCGKYIDSLMETKIYQHNLYFIYLKDDLELDFYCPVVNSKEDAYSNNDAYNAMELLTFGFHDEPTRKFVLPMKNFVRTGLDKIFFPTSTCYVSNLSTGEMLILTEELQLQFLGDTVVQI